jgi:hypothetical protein
MSIQSWGRFITNRNLKNVHDPIGDKMQAELSHHLTLLKDDCEPIPGNIAGYVRMLRGQFGVDFLAAITTSTWSDEFSWQMIWIGDTQMSACMKPECRVQQVGRTHFQSGKTDDVKKLLQIITKKKNYCVFCQDSLFHFCDDEFIKSYY